MDWLVTVLADVWKTTPFIALLLLAGLQAIPEDLYSAFRLEGGRPVQPDEHHSAVVDALRPDCTAVPRRPSLRRLRSDPGAHGGGPAGGTKAWRSAYLNAMRFLDFGYSATAMLAGFPPPDDADPMLLRLTGLVKPVQP